MFDCIIMNPPYDRNLHLKILSEAIKHLKDDNSKVVNLSPVRWLQDPLAKYKSSSSYFKFQDIRQKLDKLEIISAKDSQKVFNGTVLSIDLGIYACKSIDKEFDNESLIDGIVLKIFSKLTSFPEIEADKKDGWRVRIPMIISGKSGGSGEREMQLRNFGKLIAFEDGKRDGKWWYECFRANQYSKKTETITSSISFASKEEAENFIKSLDTKLGKYYTDAMVVDVHVNSKMILWLGNSLNPRTGKLGYESEWTDEDFYEFFGITEEEKKTIEETMAKYK